jgi:hypothetical protein
MRLHGEDVAPEFVLYSGLVPCNYMRRTLFVLNLKLHCWKYSLHARYLNGAVVSWGLPNFPPTTVLPFATISYEFGTRAESW